MELENRINEYKVSVIHIETMIDEIKKLGIDTSSFETQFKSITKRGDISANQSNIAVATMPNYGSLITELKRLEQLIRKYELYYTAIKNAHYVAENISPYDDAEKIKEYAKYMLVALKIIRNLSGEAFIDESKALQQIYEIAYQVIKIEIIKTGGSIILKNIGDIEKTYIDKYIKADLKTINTENKKSCERGDRFHLFFDYI